MRPSPRLKPAMCPLMEKLGFECSRANEKHLHNTWLSGFLHQGTMVVFTADVGWCQNMEAYSAGCSSTIFLFIINILNISVVQQREPVSKLCPNAELLALLAMCMSPCSMLCSALWCSGKMFFIFQCHWNFVMNYIFCGMWFGG